MDPAEKDRIAQWFDNFQDRLAALVRTRTGKKLLAKERVSDIMQSVFAEVWRDVVDGKIQLQDEKGCQCLLLLALTRKLRDRAKHWGRECRDVSREVDAVELDLTALIQGFEELITPNRIAAAKEELLRVEAMLDKLSEEHHRALLLVRIAGYSYEDAAAVLGISASAVRGLVSRALAKLAFLLREDGDQQAKPAS